MKLEVISLMDSMFCIPNSIITDVVFLQRRMDLKPQILSNARLQSENTRGSEKTWKMKRSNRGSLTIWKEQSSYCRKMWESLWYIPIYYRVLHHCNRNYYYLYLFCLPGQIIEALHCWAILTLKFRKKMVVPFQETP